MCYRWSDGIRTGEGSQVHLGAWADQRGDSEEEVRVTARFGLGRLGGWWKVPEGESIRERQTLEAVE